MSPLDTEISHVIFREIRACDFEGVRRVLTVLADVSELGYSAFVDDLMSMISCPANSFMPGNKLPGGIIRRIFVAEKRPDEDLGGQGEVVAVATLIVEQKFIHNGGKVGHIEDVAVAEPFQGMGIGRALVRHLCGQAFSRFLCYKVILDCSEDNVPFYERCCFHRHGVEMRMDNPLLTA